MSFPIFARLFFACTLLVSFREVSASEDPCAGASTQEKELRVVKEKKQFVLQVLDHRSQGWQVIMRSVAQIDLPRRSPDGNFLTYVSQERGTPWLFVQRLSNGWREPVVGLQTIPLSLCFDAKGTVLHIVDASGAVTDRDVSEQFKLLEPRH